MIGQDFEKIPLDVWGFHFLEPNAMIGDIILFSCSLLLAARVKRMGSAHPFYQNWQRFYLLFGISFLFGGFGHFFYHYLALWGKYPSWILGMIATYYLSLAQISLWPKPQMQSRFKIAALILLLGGIGTEIWVFNNIDLSIDQSKGLAVPTIVSGIGLIFSLVFLGIQYQKRYHPNFKYFWMAALLLLPNAMIQSQKINLAQWFDRNDFSHVLLGLSLFLYWKGIQAFKG